MLRVIYHPKAEAEFLDAVPFYGKPNPIGEDPFLNTIQRYVRDVSSDPQRFPVVAGEVRRCVVQEYPFIIFFRVAPDHVRILAVAHTSRRPEYWKRRS